VQLFYVELRLLHIFYNFTTKINFRKMSNKITVAVLFGGKSAEHEVSLASAKNVLNAIDRAKYEVVEIKIDKEGKWWIDNQSVVLSQNFGEGKIINQKTAEVIVTVDVVFPVLHGPYGEDGTLQGLVKMAGLPCVGPGTLSSSVCMDKDIAKRLFRDAGIDIADFVTIRKSEKNRIGYDDIVKKLGNELFVKPANMGSSVGVSFTDTKEKFEEALKEAFLYDDKVIVEEKVIGREIECAVLGNDFPKSSAPGEIIPTKSFYSYESKYLDEDDARLDVPAKLPEELIEPIKAIAVKAYQCLECKGLSRVDMFLTPDNRMIINEINTLPGFTKISMYPKLWDYSGIPQTALVDQLIQLAIDEFEHQKGLESSYAEAIK
jgi:D-alanine-D-alanine ligase